MKKKIVIIQPRILPYRIQTFNEISRKFQLKFLVLQKKVDNKKKFGTITNIKGINFKRDIKYFRYNKYTSKKKIVCSIFDLIKDYNPKIILSYEFSWATMASLFVKKYFNSNIKLFLLIDDDLDIYNKKKLLRKIIFFLVKKLINGIILTNHAIKREYRKNFKKETKIIVVPIIQDEDIFRNNLKKSLYLSKKNILKFKLTETKVILCVGRLIKEKNHLHLIRSFSKLKDDNIRLIIVGEGSEKPKLKKIILKLNISKKVMLLGKKENLDLYSWYNIANIFVLPSLYEPFGTVVNEALLSGVKVICSDKIGAKVLISKKDQIIFNPNDPIQLTNILNKELKKIKPIKLIQLNHLKKNLMNIKFKNINKKLLNLLDS